MLLVVLAEYRRESVQPKLLRCFCTIWKADLGSGLASGPSFSLSRFGVPEMVALGERHGDEEMENINSLGLHAIPGQYQTGPDDFFVQKKTSPVTLWLESRSF